MPPGANAVVGIEKTAILDGPTDGTSLPAVGQKVHIPGGVAVGANIRPIGKDLKAGDKLLSAGTVLGAPELGILATTGCSEVWVVRRVVVGVLSTGDELVAPTAMPGAAQVLCLSVLVPSWTISVVTLILGVTPGRARLHASLRSET